MINIRINPFYILLLFITLSGVSFFKLNFIQQSYEDELTTFNEFQHNSEAYKNLKNKIASITDVNRILIRFKKENIEQKETKSTILLTMKNNNIKKLNQFLNKILNSNFKIKKLMIQKDIIEVEIIKW
ncbi:MAG: hypothetical protein K8R39_01405 [Arcobacteraceae bacterium]|nr:hypothetical protein [Arcobacteraceae bacterium]